MSEETDFGGIAAWKMERKDFVFILAVRQFVRLIQEEKGEKEPLSKGYHSLIKKSALLRDLTEIRPEIQEEITGRCVDEFLAVLQREAKMIRDDADSHPSAFPLDQAYCDALNGFIKDERSKIRAKQAEEKSIGEKLGESLGKNLNTNAGKTPSSPKKDRE